MPALDTTSFTDTLPSYGDAGGPDGWWAKLHDAIADLLANAYEFPTGGIPETDLAAAVRSKLDEQWYQKPGTGIPSTDFSTAVQNLLTAAGTAYQKPGTGIPETDLATAVQNKLDAAGGGYVKPGGGIPESDLSTAVQNLLNSSSAPATAGAIGLVETDTNATGTPIVPLAINTVNSVLRPAGGTTNDAARINTVLAALDAAGGGTCVLHSPGTNFRIETTLLVGSKTTLVLWDADLLKIPDGAGAASTNNVVITNLHKSAAATPGDTDIRIFGIGRAKVRGQVSAGTMTTANAGATSIQLSAVLPNGTYQCWAYTTLTTVTVTNGNSTSATVAPYTATLSSGLANQMQAGYSGLCNSVKNTSATYNNFGLFFVGVTGLHVENVQVGPTNAFSSNIQMCKRVRFLNVSLDQDRSSRNQDGLDIGPGCSDVIYDNISGKTGDDGFSIYAQSTSSSEWPAVKSAVAATPALGNISDITIRNCKIDIGINPFRVQCGDGCNLNGLLFENITDLHASYLGRDGTQDTRAVVQFGNTNYITTPPGVGDFSNVTVRGYKGRCNFLCTTDDTYSDVTFDGVELLSAADGSCWTALLGWTAQVPSYSGTISNIAFRNIRSNVPASNVGAGTGYCINPGAGVVSNVSLDGVHMVAIRAITKSAVNITGLTLGKQKYGTIVSALYASTAVETGSADTPDFDTFSGPTTYVTSPCNLRLAPGHPTVLAGAQVPNPVAGSEITASGVDPTGGSTTAAAIYRGDGSSWNRVVTLANTPGARPSAPTGLTATGGLGSVNLNWTASATGSATNYAIYRSTTTGTESLIATTSSAATSYADSSVSGTGTYYYKVGGVNANGTGVLSGEASAAATSAGTVVFSDTFNRTATTSGGNWTTAGAATFPTNGTVMGLANTSATTATTYTNLVTAGAFTAASATDIFASFDTVTVGSTPTPGYQGVMINWSDDSNYYYASYDATATQWKISKSVAATITVIANTATGTAVPTTPFNQRLQNSAGTLKLYVNGVLTLTVADSSLTGTRVGIRLRGGGASGANTQTETQQMDNFKCGSVS